jgi:hypothetical protein
MGCRTSVWRTRDADHKMGDGGADARPGPGRTRGPLAGYGDNLRLVDGAVRRGQTARGIHKLPMPNPRRVLLSALLLLPGCDRAPAPDPKVAAKPVPTAKAPATPELTAKPDPTATSADRLGCTANAECTASCRHGAVSRAWHTATYPGGEACEDGCTSKGTEPPRCENRACVAYRAGARDPLCTALDVDPIPGPGPAHRCDADEQCTLSCARGAVNTAWLSWHAEAECRDGCTGAGAGPPRSGACRRVAYRGGKPDTACTELPIER